MGNAKEAGKVSRFQITRQTVLGIPSYFFILKGTEDTKGNTDQHLMQASTLLKKILWGASLGCFNTCRIGFIGKADKKVYLVRSRQKYVVEPPQ